MSHKNKKGCLGEIFEIIRVFVMAIVLAMVIVQFVRPTRVDGISMYPTLDNNDYLIINRISRYTGVKKGDIVVFDSDMPISTQSKSKSTIRNTMDFVLQDDSQTKDLVKRVIAVGGDKIQIKNGVVRVNGQAIEESYVSPGNRTDGNIDTVVPQGKLFCMGDNRSRSLDSRYPEVGFVSEENLIGSIMIRLLPLDSLGPVE